MNIDQLRKYALAKPGVTDGYPFGPEACVFKVVDKMFMLARLPRDPLEINLKCDPDRALMLREIFEAVGPGYHMNKRHWNTVILDGTVPDETLRELIDHSYDLVAGRLTKAKRVAIGI